MATNPQEFDDKGIPAARLIELLSTLPPDTYIAGNIVLNLALYTTDWTFIGYIDVRRESLTLTTTDEG